MTNAGFHFALPVRVLNAARHTDRTVMLMHVAIERIEGGIVDVGREHAFAEIIELLLPPALCGLGRAEPLQSRRTS